ncbi:bacillithiol system redox-active protein YtxJ [Salipaludibacillus aurantiacus]|uniref:Bacillithiol system protein YtxJ n=1 Tax=Salipaludibacillus aurantiacus TaxID=1601833 RepID=A0A1H9WMT9_9BACI|nr:bacillithiol system redox-active protein YtxJ [Salipaludibacillus aurantiacus]SES35256.1 bacillithiol system protein YtxJ [Salipaludibacillus aurantiacus]
MSIKKIESKEELQQVQGETERFFLLKNSITCPVSREALEEMEKYSDSDSALPVYYLNVQELREVSNGIADEYGIKHESPQVFLIQKNDVVWDASHWKVTKKNAERAAEAL